MAITSGIAELKVYGHILESEALQKKVVNVYHYAQAATGVTLPPNTDIVTAFTQNVVQPLLALLSGDYTVDEIGCRVLDVHSFPETVVINSLPGLKVGDRLPTYATVCVQLKSAFRGREYRGSKHVGPIVEADTTQDELSAAVLGAWRAWAGILANNLTTPTATLIPVILSRKLSQLAKDPITLSAVPVSQAILNKTLGTLRKRKIKTAVA